jgi:ribose/xylose/arabinose/galactoside ABC-type transport system permease subunit
MTYPPPPPDQYPQAHEKPPYRLRINMLCLFGAMLAVVSLFLPWAMIQNQLADETNIGAFDFDEPLAGGSEFPDSFRYSITLFMIGTALSFLTPLGGIPLMIGAVGFISTSLTSNITNHDLIPWLGAVIALLSAGVVLLSFIEPTGMGFDSEKEDRMVAKMLTWSVYR